MLLEVTTFWGNLTGNNRQLEYVVRNTSLIRWPLSKYLKEKRKICQHQTKGIASKGLRRKHANHVPGTWRKCSCGWSGISRERSGRWCSRRGSRTAYHDGDFKGWPLLGPHRRGSEQWLKFGVEYCHKILSLSSTPYPYKCCTQRVSTAQAYNRPPSQHQAPTINQSFSNSPWGMAHGPWSLCVAGAFISSPPSFWSGPVCKAAPGAFIFRVFTLTWSC